jgi:hypothetical protein
MSRAAAANATKGAQKAMLKEKANTHAADLAMGLTATMKKAIAADTLLCTSCGATELGPTARCDCPGGRTKPAPGYDAKKELLFAAQERHRLGQSAKMAEGAARQSSVQASKAKRAAEKEQDAEDLDLSTQDLCEITFPQGKLGMSLEKNVVSAVAVDGAAATLKVVAGWVVRMVNGADAPPKKDAIMKLAGAAMKAGELRITFQFPLEEGQHHCSACDKFVAADAFAGASNDLAAGPGKQVCASCEEYGDMFG